MLEFRQHAAKILEALRFGKETVRLTYRGKAVADLVPVQAPKSRRPPQDDPFYRLVGIAAMKGTSMTNQEIDRVLYGQS